MDNINDYQRFTIQLSLTPGIGPVKFQKLLQEYKTIETLYCEYKNKKLANLNIINISKNEIDLLIKDSKFICFWEEDYPENLRNIPDAPIFIFYKGNKELLKNILMISIVGSRRMSSYGESTLRKIISQLSGSNFIVVSGMANGIDSVAHRAAIQNNIPTIAVLASSVDEPTPYSNRALYNDILKNNGLIISETFPDHPIQDGYFPRRNRVIAGISKGTLVVEAGEKSGSLITANLATSYSREVFAIPANLNSLYSVGSNTLIKESKAKLVQDVNDIFDEFQIGYKNLVITKDLSKLSTLELEIYNYIKSEPRLVEEVANFLNIDFSVIISSCSLMEMKNLISKNEIGQYYIN